MPGYLLAGRWRRKARRLATPDARRAVSPGHGIRRFGLPEDVAALVAFTDSPAGGYSKRAIIDLDCGMTKGIWA